MIPESIPTLPYLPINDWLSAARNRQPDQIIGDGEKVPYMRRWFIIPPNDKQNVYLHHFLRDDKDTPHDHPWPSVSIILDGGYREQFLDGSSVLRNPGNIVDRPAEQAHRIVLLRDRRGGIIQAWTLFFTGPKIREWGFHCPQGWVHWKKFTAANDSGLIGEGCGQ